MFRLFAANRLCFGAKSMIITAIRRHTSGTIYALSTAIKSTGSAIAVIRISGEKASEALPHLIRKRCIVDKCVDNPRMAVFTQLHDHISNELLDSSLVIFFKKPFSYTGEDMCEFHVHGSNAVINGVLSVLSRIDDFRPALTGEFTKRALINDKMDLIQVEAINDLIKAQTDSQRRRALSAINGLVTQKYDNWRTNIIKIMANIEAVIDFGEEELIDDAVFAQLKSQISVLQQDIRQYLKNSKNKSDLIKDGLKVGIIGAPNVGKSSLINKLSERNVAIVSDISGTTRDIIETWLNIRGYPVSLSDTAGIKDLGHELKDPIEREGIVRAIERAKSCELLLFVMDAKTLMANGFQANHYRPDYLKSVISDNTKLIYLVNKIDLLSDQELDYLQKQCNQLFINWSPISCKTSFGFYELMQMFEEMVEQMCGNPLSETLFTTVRHESHLTKALQQMQSSIESLDNDIAVAAHHLRQAAQQISQITGRITTEDVLDVIFRDFCIGK